MEPGSPLTLQLAARVERTYPPAVADICAAAALATLGLLEDDRSSPGGEWHEAVEAWNGARIRKLVRRARGAAWQRATEVPGVTASAGRAEVRAFVPGPQAEAPEAVRKLQIQSPGLPIPADLHHLPRRPKGSDPTQKGSDPMVLAITPELPMSWGKQAAQCAHGAQRLWQRQPGPPGWLEEPDIEVIHPCSILWAELARFEPVEIRDGGYTEIPAGTLTVRAFWA